MQRENKTSLHYNLDVMEDVNTLRNIDNLPAILTAIQGVQAFKTALDDGIKTELKSHVDTLSKALSAEKKDISDNEQIEKTFNDVLELVKTRYVDIFKLHGVTVQ